MASILLRTSTRVMRPTAVRAMSTFRTQQQSKGTRFAKYALATGVVGVTTFGITHTKSTTNVDWEAVRKDIVDILEDESYDDGSYGPVLVRLAWHASGTYDKKTKTGGSDGATMRFQPEAGHGANAGLEFARKRLEPIAKKYPGISYGDLWTFASKVAIEEMGGPDIPWRPGRTDKPDGSHCTPDGRLPDGAKRQDHLRDIFYRMGWTDREIVCLAGAHALGRCHPDRSGFWGPWTFAPTTFSNEYFKQLIENKWTPKKWNGPHQYEDPTGALMMLPADLALIEDPEFRKYVEMYAKDEELFFKDFADCFGRLLELGVKFEAAKPWYQFW
eukprot:Clim_evm25s235 gene=Clim_evmTU25s235